MTFGNLKKWELITIGGALAAAVILRVLDAAGIFRTPPLYAVIAMMILAAVLMLWRPAVFLAKHIRGSSRATRKELFAVGIDLIFAVFIEGVLTVLMLNLER